MFRPLSFLCPTAVLALAALGACATGPGASRPVEAAPDDPVEMVRVLSSEAMAGRRAGSPGGAAARAYLTAQLEASGLAATEQPFAYESRRGAGSGVNLLTRIAGTDDLAPVLVVTAHYDHLGARGGVVFSGADDNASGVAGAVALARALRADPARHDVIVVLTDAEEMGLQGARALFGGGPLTGQPVAAALNLDMIGRDDGDELYAVGTHHWPALRAPLETVAADAAVPLAFGYDAPTDDPRDDWTMLSDHAAFHERGVPFVYLGVEDHADYHRPSDTFENLDADFFLGEVATAERVLRALDEAAAAGIVAPRGPLAPGS